MSIGARIVSVIVGFVLYAGLAILGWDGFHPFFSHPPFIALMAVLFAGSLVALFAGGSLSAGEREDRSNRWVLIVFTVVGLVSGYLPAYTDRVDFWTIDGNTVRWVGVGLFAVGLAVRIWPVFVLGNRFSGLVAIQPGHTLVTTNIYSVIRHPSYVGLFITAIGWALAFRSGIGLMLAAIYVPALLARINSEERLLQSQFGSEYDAYRARTYRLIPGVY